jgi:hypothetical protein
MTKKGQSDPRANGDKARQPDVARVAMRIAGIRNIAMRSGSFHVLRDATAKPGQVLLSVPIIKATATEDQLTLTADFEMHGVEASSDDESVPEEFDQGYLDDHAIVKITARFAIAYSLESGEPFSEDDLEAFGYVNGMLNLNPFWREYVHNCLTRADVAVFYIPPFNPLKIAKRSK